MSLASRPPFVAGQGVAINLATADFTGNFGALWVGTAGNITLTGMDGQNVTYPNVPVGWFAHAGTAVIKATTTASGLVASN